MGKEKVNLDKASIRHEVAETIKKLGIKANFRGYEYIKEAVCLCIDDNSKLHALTTQLYPEIAQKYGNVTPGSVDRCVRHAIKYALCDGNPNMLVEIFGYIPVKSTNSHFIAQLSEYIRIKFNIE